HPLADELERAGVELLDLEEHPGRLGDGAQVAGLTGAAPVRLDERPLLARVALGRVEGGLRLGRHAGRPEVVARVVEEAQRRVQAGLQVVRTGASQPGALLEQVLVRVDEERRPGALAQRRPRAVGHTASAYPESRPGGAALSPGTGAGRSRSRARR